MIPFPMLPTASGAERQLYEGFLAQLSDDYVVYHSVEWVLASPTPGAPPIEGECDFLIAHPDDGLLVREAKGGQVRYDPSTRRWMQTGHSGTHVLDEDPFHQAQDEMRSLVEILSAQPGWDRWRPSYGYGVAFPDDRFDSDSHCGAKSAWAIDHDDLHRLAERVSQMMGQWQQPGRRFGAEGMDALHRSLGLKVEIRGPLSQRLTEEDRRIIELTDDQAYVLSFVTKRHRAAIVGPAGSGKTMLALQVAIQLSAGGNYTLLTCFSGRLAQYLRDSTSSTAHLDVYHFLDLCKHFASEAGLTVSESPQESGDPARVEQRLPHLLGIAASILGPRNHAIVVDEAQDFPREWWAPLLSLHVDPKEGDLFVFADNNQALCSGWLPEDLVDLTLSLPANMRNSTPIHEFVTVFLPGRAASRRTRPTWSAGRGTELPRHGRSGWPPGQGPEELGAEWDSALRHRGADPGGSFRERDRTARSGGRVPAVGNCPTGHDP